MSRAFLLMLIAGCSVGVEPTAPLIVKHQVDFSQFEPGIRKYCEEANPAASEAEVQECIDSYMINLIDILANGGTQ